MIEENNDIFLAGGAALVCLAVPMNKKYSTTFVWSHPFSTYLSWDRFSIHDQKVNAKNLNRRTKTSLRTKRALELSFSIIFKGFSVAKNCLRPESAPLML